MLPFTLPVQVVRAALLGIALLLTSPASVTAVGNPTPDPATAGSYLNWPNCHFGQYRLQRTAARVSLELTSFVASAACLENTPARAMFVLPAAYRPPLTIIREVAVMPGPRFLVPEAACRAACRLRLRVEPDGRVHYEPATPAFYSDELHTARESTDWGGTPEGEFTLSTQWGATPAANDQVVLAILDELWFGKPVFTRIPVPTREKPHIMERGRCGFLALSPEGRVSELILEGHTVSAPIPPEMGQLTGLKHLYLSALFGIRADRTHGLTGPIPAELGQLRQLRKLQLTSNLLTGPIPPELGQLANLQLLDLQNNLLTRSIPSELGQLQQLQYLDLSYNLLTGSIPPELGQLRQLQFLYLDAHRRRVGLHGYDLLWLLNELAAENLIVEPDARQSDSGFQFADTRLTGPIPPELGQLPRLLHLSLQRHQLTGPIPPELGQLSHLTHLDLTQNQLTGPIPPELGQLAHLTHLFLDYNRLTGAIPSELWRITDLQELHLAYNRLTGFDTPADTTSPLHLHFMGLTNNIEMNECRPAFLRQRAPDLRVSCPTQG